MTANLPTRASLAPRTSPSPSSSMVPSSSDPSWASASANSTKRSNIALSTAR
eukprot:CAMPEP_0115502870 /NCGR_PEP_ID=MMETSP0271-20121206/69175_1 /TAXON_ID=71861 /ORGANISM="Scrippsiella trochoidea, Strain CCMP3099" /LENGTH=51 /DNA_ID=CAMNT_0002931927 /DNA_START=211 /DNA_END=366 /DNA_ORIENTATION=-